MANALAPVENLSEVMAALTPMQRAFVDQLFEVKPGHGHLTRAARAAGYGENSTNETLARIANKLVHNPKVQAAIQEITRKSISRLGPAAVHAIEDIVNDPTGKERLKAARTILEHVAPATQYHQHDVAVTVVNQDKETISAIRKMLALGMSREQIETQFGAFGAERYFARIEAEDREKANVIEGEFSVVEAEPEDWGFKI